LFYYPLKHVGRAIEKIIGEKLQFQLISKNFVHPNQLGELKQHLTMDTGVFLTYLIHSGWVKNLQMSTLALDIIQFSYHSTTSFFLLFWTKLVLIQKYLYSFLTI